MKYDERLKTTKYCGKSQYVKNKAQNVSRKGKMPIAKKICMCYNILRKMGIKRKISNEDLKRRF